MKNIKWNHKKYLIQNKTEIKEKGKREQIEQIENKQPYGRFKHNHIYNHICKWQIEIFQLDKKARHNYMFCARNPL